MSCIAWSPFDNWTTDCCSGLGAGQTATQETEVEADGTHTLAGCIVAADMGRWELVEVQFEELFDKQEQAEDTADVIVVQVIEVLHMKNWEEWAGEGVGVVLKVGAVV